MLSLTGTQTTCQMNHQWKAHLSQSPVIWFKESYLSDEDEKALGPSGIVLEMIRAAGDLGASMICDHASFAMVRYSHGAVSLSASTRVRGMHGKGETDVV